MQEIFLINFIGATLVNKIIIKCTIREYIICIFSDYTMSRNALYTRATSESKPRLFF